MINIIRDFVEGRLDAVTFFDALYRSDEMEAEFLAEKDLPQWVNTATLFDYLITGDMSTSFIWEAKELLGYYLKKKGIAFIQDRQEAIEQAVVLKAMPEWLSLEPDYFEAILRDKTLTESEKIKAIKSTVQSEFKYLHNPPNWLQAPDWPFYQNKPLVFIGELEEGRVPGRSRVYVFFCKETGYICINQTD